MRYFIYENGQPQGPFDIEQLASKGITAETLVWYQGMEGWRKAKEIPELSDITLPTPPPINNPSEETQQYMEPCPDNNMGIAIAATIMSFMGCYIIGSAIGVIAIVYASKVKGYWNDGFYDEAEEYARKAKTWAIIGIILPIVFLVLMFFSFGPLNYNH